MELAAPFQVHDDRLGQGQGQHQIGAALQFSTFKCSRQGAFRLDGLDIGILQDLQ